MEKSLPPLRPHHMPVRWHDLVGPHDVLAVDATLKAKVTVIARTGQLMLGCGPGAWRVRDLMNRVGRILGVTVHADISLANLEVTCIQGPEVITEVVANASAGVNTERQKLMEDYLHEVEALGHEITIGAYHDMLDIVETSSSQYAPWQSAMAAGFACGAFVFLLGGGPVEMVCAALGAGLGQFIRKVIAGRHGNPFAGVAAGVAAACIVYLVALNLLGVIMGDVSPYQAGYIGSMLFVIPGFPLITAGFDFYQMEMRSGLERLAFALITILSAGAVAWLVANVVHLAPDDFLPQGLAPWPLFLLRLLFSFIGVYGFSVMFNSTPRMCVLAGCIGAVANTLRLTLAGATMPPEAAAFLGAFVAGLLASRVSKRFGVPRTASTVPSIVIMVPGLYMYKAVYFFGAFDVTHATEWLVQAAMIVLFLPIGLIAARIVTDRRWRCFS